MTNACDNPVLPCAHTWCPSASSSALLHHLCLSCMHAHSVKTLIIVLSACLLFCSTALHTTSIWSNTIGLQQEQAGTNQAIEAQIYAPGGGGGGGRAAKRQRAQELIEASR